MINVKAFFKETPVTASLLVVTVLVFLATQLLFPGISTESEIIFHIGGMYGNFVRYNPTQLWRLVSPIFIHIGWRHFLLNTFSLYLFGAMAEKIFGSFSYAILYVFSGIMGNLFVFTLTPDVVEAGASTSLFGLLAAIAFLMYSVDNPYLRQLGHNYFVLGVLNLVFNIFTPDVSLAGHLGGAIGGILLGISLPIKIESNVFSKKVRVASGLAYLVLVVLLLIIGFTQ